MAKYDIVGSSVPSEPPEHEHAERDHRERQRDQQRADDHFLGGCADCAAARNSMRRGLPLRAYRTFVSSAKMEPRKYTLRQRAKGRQSTRERIVEADRNGGPPVIWQCPDDAAAALVLAHGAGMRHRNMQSIADAFATHGIATLRFDFPFIAERRKRVDPPAVATACIAAACAAAAARTDLPLWLGGHSFGGRMASHAVLDEALAPRGLIFCAFPLHAPGKPGNERARHLARIRLPILFLSGTRDALAERALLEPLVASLSSAELHLLDTADHGYRVKQRVRGGENVFDEMARIAREFIERHA
jgi:uncharacterized protein